MKALPRTFIVTGISTPWGSRDGGKVFYNLAEYNATEDSEDFNTLGAERGSLSLLMHGSQAQRFPAVGSIVTVDIRINEAV